MICTTLAFSSYTFRDELNGRGVFELIREKSSVYRRCMNLCMPVLIYDLQASGYKTSRWKMLEAPQLYWIETMIDFYTTKNLIYQPEEEQ